MKKRKDGRYLKVMNYKKMNGETYPKYFYGTTENEVFKKISEYEVEHEAGRSFKDVAKEWKTEHYPTVVYNTQRGYERSYKQAVNHFGKYPIKEISSTLVRAYVDNFKKKGYAAKTVTHHLSILKLIFVHAVIKGDVLTNPSEHVKVPAGLKKTKRLPPSANDIEIIKSNVALPFGLYPFFILYTGLRKSEALALQYQDIDFDKRKISVNKAWYTIDRKPYIKKTKTKAGERIVPLLDPLYEALSPNKNLEKYLFGFPTDTVYENLWEEYKQATNIQCTPHQIRHEFVTMLYDFGIDDFDAMHIVGHANISTMRDIYTHIREGRSADIGNLINKKLAEKET